MPGSLVNELLGFTLFSIMLVDASLCLAIISITYKELTAKKCFSELRTLVHDRKTRVKFQEAAKQAASRNETIDDREDAQMYRELARMYGWRKHVKRGVTVLVFLVIALCGTWAGYLGAYYHFNPTTQLHVSIGIYWLVAIMPLPALFGYMFFKLRRLEARLQDLSDEFDNEYGE